MFRVILQHIINFFEIFMQFYLSLIVYFIISMCKLTSSNCYQTKETRTQMVGYLLGPKPLPLGEENPCVNSYYRDSIDEYQDMAVNTICLSKTKTSILHFSDHHLHYITESNTATVF